MSESGGALSTFIAQPDVTNFSEIAANAGVEDHSAHWYAVHVRLRHEKKVAVELAEKRVTAFLPLISTKRKWSDRHRMVELPLFPSYVFVRIPLEQDLRVAVLRTNGVNAFVGPRGIGTPIPDSEMDAVRAVLASADGVQAHPYLNIGSRVRVRGGSLDGVEGVLTAVNGDQSLVISIELIQRSLAVRVTGFAVEPA